MFHYDTPVFWETENFRVVDGTYEAEDVIRIVRDYRPGPHLLSVVTTEPEHVIAEYAALGYRDTPQEPRGILMAKSIGAVDGSESGAKSARVERAATLEQLRIYNSALDPDDGHGLMTEAELGDPSIGSYYIVNDGRCVCAGRSIQPFAEGITVEPLETHKEYRGRGLASALMERVERDGVVRGAKFFAVDATQRAVPFYETLGFIQSGFVQKLIPTDP